MTFDGTVTLGSVLTLLGCVVTVGIGMWRFGQRIDKLEWRTNLMWQWFQRRFGTNGERFERDSRA